MLDLVNLPHNRDVCLSKRILTSVLKSLNKLLDLSLNHMPMFTVSSIDQILIAVYVTIGLKQ